MITNYNLLFYLKKPKNYESGPMPVYMRIKVNGKSAEISVNRKAFPDRWCSRSHRENGTKDSAKGLNSYLDDLQRKLAEAHLKLMNERKRITSLNLKNKFLDRNDIDYFILEVFKAHNTEMEAMLGVEFEPNTLKGYKTSLGHLQNYIKTKYRTADQELDRLDYSFIRDYDYYLKRKLSVYL